MINGNDEQNLEYSSSLCYLLDPCFQIVNTHGSPLTSGWIEVYIHGTRTKYYCSSDFDGTLHPFRIPLDSLGSNIVLADPDQAYDVYVYNKYGTLQMSRYNVKPGSGGSGSGQIVIDDKPISRIQVISNVLDGPDWVGKSWKYALSEVVGDKLAWRQDGEDMNLGNVYAKAGTYHYDFIVKVDWTGELRNEIVRFQILGINPSDRDTWHSFDLSYPHTEFYHFSSFSNRMPGYEDRIFVDLDISPYGGAPEGLTAEVHTLTIFSIEDSVSVHTGLDKVHHDETMTGDGSSSNPLSVSETVNQIYEVITSATSGKLDSSAYVAPVQSDWNQNDPSALDFILNKPNLGNYATHQEVVEATSGKLDTSAYTAPVQSDWSQSNSSALDYIKNKPESSELIPGPGIDITASGNNYVISSTASGDVSKQYVDEHLAEKLDTSAYTSPVQSDWNENDQSDLSFIKNKPTECSLIAGQNVWLEDMTSGVRINCSASGGGGSGVTEEYVQQAVASGTSGKLDIEDYTAPVQSDWNQSNSSMLDYIKNKPENSQLLEGPGISITASGNDFVISTSGSVNEQYVQDAIMSAVSDLPSTSYVDDTVASATSGKLDTSAYTAPVQSDWTEPDAAALSYIKNKPTECSLIAGQNVWIEDVTSGVRINCSASGGGPVPEGVMVESELKYNAVGEISGYGESPIAQYGAEKQWLVHDDTIVHQSNSAQYAFGVNLSAVAQLLGIDETVLWENESSPLQNSGGTAVLSEDPSVFKYLRFEYRGEQASGHGVKTSTVYNDGNLSSICVGGLAQFYDNYAFSFTGAHIMIVGTTLTLVRQGRFNVNDNDTISATDHGNGMFKLVRVVGIGRKQSN